MFERFTERARKVVVLSQQEVNAFMHDYVGTEHLLAALIAEDEGIAAQALKSLCADLEDVREQIMNIVGYGETETGQPTPFTPRTQKVLEMALREALHLGHNHIGTEHLLLGLMQEREGVSARILSNLGVDQDAVRLRTMAIIREKAGQHKKDTVETARIETRKKKEAAKRQIVENDADPMVAIALVLNRIAAALEDIAQDKKKRREMRFGG